LKQKKRKKKKKKNKKMELNSEDQLKIVDSRIKACETDLKGSFKGNAAIIHKVNVYKQQREELLKKIKENEEKGILEPIQFPKYYPKLDDIDVITEEGKKLLKEIFEKGYRQYALLTQEESDKLLNNYVGIRKDIPNIIWAIARCLCAIEDEINKEFSGGRLFNEYETSKRIIYDKVEKVFKMDLRNEKQRKEDKNG